MDSYTLSQKLFGFNLHRHAHRHLRDHFIPHEGNNHTPHALHHRALFLYSALLVVAKVAVITLPVLAPYGDAQALSVTSENIFSLTNETRAGEGLNTLTYNPKLAVAAMNKAEDMMSKGYFAHHSPEGLSPWYWFVQAGYDYSVAGENLAIRFDTAEGVTAAWLASPSHKANLMSPDFTEIGVAVLKGDFSDEGPVTLVVQLFGTPNQPAIATAPKASQPTSRTPETIVASEPVPQKVLASTKTPTQLTSSVKITFPIEDSAIKTSKFEILGQASGADSVELYTTEEVLGSTRVVEEKFVYQVEKDFAEGDHMVGARTISGESDEVNFKIDLTAPTVDQEKLFVSPKLGSSDTFNVTAAVSDDSVRTLVLVGEDSSALERNEDGEWTGQIKLYNFEAGATIPIEIYAQDMAGNETRVRVGFLQPGNVAGAVSLFGQQSPDTQVNIFGNVLGASVLQKNIQSFYLFFTIFLASALLLKIMIRYHIQHPKVIAGGAGVMMLAMVMFMI